MKLNVFDLGLVDFRLAQQFQERIFYEVKKEIIAFGLILCQHYPVITLGRTAKKENILISEEELKNKGIAVYVTQRGGDVTYHGPGQLLVYPIFNLSYLKKDIHWFLRRLEGLLINLFFDFGLNTQRRRGLTGVWVGEKKIASIGIAIKNWITFYGLSINIKKNDLDNFRFIRPCGMDIEMTTLEESLNKEVEVEVLKEKIVPKFQDIFIIPKRLYQGGIHDQSILTGIGRGD
ncbi:MAG: lipoyl(octanoyl) transferase LipB [Candidatus Omnitrophica bacterium]|nr:lipoyl(octanoyl) transferase LipB [Candidatus Omnitrophota bacterium]